MVWRSSAWSLPWEKVILMMLLTPCGLDFVNTLLYHLKALQLSFFLFFLFSFPTLSQGYNTLERLARKVILSKVEQRRQRQLFEARNNLLNRQEYRPLSYLAEVGVLPRYGFTGNLV